MEGTVSEIDHLLPSNVDAAGLSLVLQVLCLELSLAQHGGLVRIMLYAIQLSADWAWFALASNGTWPSWSSRMTMLGIHVGQAGFALWIFRAGMPSPW